MEIQAIDQENVQDILIDENIQILDNQEFSDYIAGDGEWGFAQDLYASHTSINISI